MFFWGEHSPFGEEVYVGSDFFMQDIPRVCPEILLIIIIIINMGDWDYFKVI